MKFLLFSFDYLKKILNFEPDLGKVSINLFNIETDYFKETWKNSKRKVQLK